MYLLLSYVGHGNWPPISLQLLFKNIYELNTFNYIFSVAKYLFKSLHWDYL